MNIEPQKSNNYPGKLNQTIDNGDCYFSFKLCNKNEDEEPRLNTSFNQETCLRLNTRANEN